MITQFGFKPTISQVANNPTELTLAFMQTEWADRLDTVVDILLEFGANEVRAHMIHFYKIVVVDVTQIDEIDALSRIASISDPSFDKNRLHNMYYEVGDENILITDLRLKIIADLLTLN